MQIIIALDNVSFDKALELMVLLGDFVDGFKINHTLLEHTSMFENYEGELFIDFKLWDTPATVCSVVEMILKKGATMTTISTFNNDEVFKDLHQYSEDIKLLGVTYLTSWSDTEQYKIVREPKSNMWDRNLKRIRKSGFSGIVCSAQDIKDIEDTSVLRICPGITFHSHNHGQSRTTTPRLAQDLGADYIIIGRSVTLSDDPVKTIVDIKKTLD
jgi:orotidine-5'-phosphate decarboxylase|tara:strand:+ start:64 stop:705 length:642 start_codon:yes stop_codon:yes gene_type:complete